MTNETPSERTRKIFVEFLASDNRTAYAETLLTHELITLSRWLAAEIDAMKASAGNDDVDTETAEGESVTELGTISEIADHFQVANTREQGSLIDVLTLRQAAELVTVYRGRVEVHRAEANRGQEALTALARRFDTLAHETGTHALANTGLKLPPNTQGGIARGEGTEAPGGFVSERFPGGQIIRPRP